MKINIVSEYNGVSSVRKIQRILGTNEFPELDNATTCFDKTGINIFVADYTPVCAGDILIKYPNKVWKKLRTNSKIVNQILKRIEYREPHCFRKSNILASIKLSKIKYIEIKD